MARYTHMYLIYTYVEIYVTYVRDGKGSVHVMLHKIKNAQVLLKILKSRFTKRVHAFLDLVKN